MSKALVLSAFLLAAFPAFADEPADQTQAPAPAASDKSQSTAGQDAQSDIARAYCVSQTGTHLPERKDACSHGVSVSRQEWEDRGGTSAADFVRKGIP